MMALEYQRVVSSFGSLIDVGSIVQLHIGRSTEYSSVVHASLILNIWLHL
jgi:hypothetical protein